MAKKSTAKKSRSTSKEKYNDLPSMNSEYTDFNSGSNRRTRLASGRAQPMGTSEHEYISLVHEFVTNPKVKYVAGEIATALLAKLATKLSDKYPEISNFIRENLESVESKISKERTIESESARH